MMKDTGSRILFPVQWQDYERLRGRISRGLEWMSDLHARRGRDAVEGRCGIRKRLICAGSRLDAERFRLGYRRFCESDQDRYEVIYANE